MVRHHHFPQHFENALSNQQKFQLKEIFGQSGRKIDRYTVDTIKEQMRNHTGDLNPQHHVIILGGNNLRNGEYLPEEILPFYEELTQCATLINCSLTIVGIIPSPLSDNTFGLNFIHMNYLLKTLCSLYRPNCFYFGIGKYLTENGFINRDYFERDGVHLNNAGASILAQYLVEHLVQNV